MNKEQLFMILKKPHTSEKSMIVADKLKQFTFEVLKTATKPQIKKAVEELFNVKVKNVATLCVKGKTKRFRQHEGTRRNWKKAYVSLHPDYDIDFTVSE